MARRHGVPARQSAMPRAVPVAGESATMTLARRAHRARRLVSRPGNSHFLIAVGIGLHNFAEGLAIGQAAAKSEIALATLFVIGFALHNATEGFGIVAPLAGEVTEDGQRVAAELGFPARDGCDRWRSDLHRHGRRSHVHVAGAVGRVPLARGRIDPLRRDPARSGIAAKNRRMDLLAYGLLIGHHRSASSPTRSSPRQASDPMFRNGCPCGGTTRRRRAPKTTRYDDLHDDADDHVVRVPVVGEHRLPGVEVVRREAVTDATELA